jgi:Ca2+-binding RTX toxin-like protein
MEVTLHRGAVDMFGSLLVVPKKQASVASASRSQISYELNPGVLTYSGKFYTKKGSRQVDPRKSLISSYSYDNRTEPDRYHVSAQGFQLTVDKYNKLIKKDSGRTLVRSLLSGDDTITAYGAGSTVAGFLGNDHLISSGSQQALYGGEGADRFNLLSAGYSNAENSPIIADFNPSEGDVIVAGGSSLKNRAGVDLQSTAKGLFVQYYTEIGFANSIGGTVERWTERNVFSSFYLAGYNSSFDPTPWVVAG